MKRVTLSEAAETLGVSVSTVRRLVRSGVLSCRRNQSHANHGVRLYLIEGEVRAMAVGGVPAARGYRQRHGY